MPSEITPIGTTSTAIRTRRLGRSVPAVAIATAIALAGCGDDEGASGEYREFCVAELAVEEATLGDDPAAVEAAFTALVAASPDGARPLVERTIAEATAFMEAGMPPTPEFNEAYGEMISLMKDECGYEELETAAVDYSFDGVPDELPGGPTIVTFENKGTEFHEMIVIKRGDGVDAPAVDLLMMDSEEVGTMVSDVGGAFAAPGTTAYTVVDLEPGRYIVACFLPQGATEEAWDAMMSGGPEPDGDPHAMHGMIAEFEVTT